MNYVMEAAGWIATVLILASYWLLSTDKLQSRSPIYQWMNVAGAAGFIVNCMWKGAYPSVVLNVFWVGIAATALVRNRARS